MTGLRFPHLLILIPPYFKWEDHNLGAALCKFAAFKNGTCCFSAQLPALLERVQGETRSGTISPAPTVALAVLTQSCGPRAIVRPFVFSQNSNYHWLKSLNLLIQLITKGIGKR